MKNYVLLRVISTCAVQATLSKIVMVDLGGFVCKSAPLIKKNIPGGGPARTRVAGSASEGCALIADRAEGRGCECDCD